MAYNSNINVVDQWTITGNDATTNTIASIAEMQVKDILRNNEDMLFARLDATSKSIIQMGAMGTGIYRLPTRTSFGTDYDVNNGVQRQRTGALSTVVQMNQHLTIEVMWEDFDMTRFLEASPAVRATLMSQWLMAIMQSYLLSLEAILLRGVIDYNIAMGNKLKNLMVVNPADIKTPEDAQALYIQIREVVNGWRKLFSKTAMGADMKNVRVIMSAELYTALVAKLQNFIINDLNYTRLETGDLHKDTIMGVPVREHLMLNNSFKKADFSEINKDLDFDFTGVHLIMYLDDAIAMPLGMEKTETIKDNLTLNPKLISKNMGSLPEVLRPEYMMVGMEKLPDQATITAKQSLKGNGSDKFDYTNSFQLADYDTDFGTAPVTPPTDNSKITIKSAVASADGLTITVKTDTLVVDAKAADFTLGGTLSASSKITQVAGKAGATSVVITVAPAVVKADKPTLAAYATTTPVAVDTTGVSK